MAEHSREHGKEYRSGYQQGLLDGRDKQIVILRDRIRELETLVENSVTVGDK